MSFPIHGASWRMILNDDDFFSTKLSCKNTTPSATQTQQALEFELY